MYSNLTKFRAIIHYCEFLRSLRKVAEKYKVGKSTLARWVKESGREPPCRRVRAKLHDVIGATVVSTIDTNPTTIAMDMIKVIEHAHGICVSPSTIYRTLRRVGYTLKVVQRSRKHQNIDIRHPFFAHSSPYSRDIISVDEASFCWGDRPRRGWGPRGSRVPKIRPGRRSRVSLLLAIGQEGVIAHRLVRGGTNGAVFADFIRELPDGRPIIMDNASIHKTRIVKDTLRSKCICPIYIPPYSPWYNPVEFAFSWIKRRFRRNRACAILPSTLESDVKYAVGLLPEVSPYFRHCNRVWSEDALKVRSVVHWSNHQSQF